MLEKVNILGTEYKIKVCKVADDKELLENRFAGYCDFTKKLIAIADMTETQYFGELSPSERKLIFNCTARHEVLHAYLNESGLRQNSHTPECWALNEEMIDWFALQTPKIYKTYKEMGVL